MFFLLKCIDNISAYSHYRFDWSEVPSKGGDEIEIIKEAILIKAEETSHILFIEMKKE